MVDFKKIIGKKEIEKKTNPIEIYDSLDRRSETGPLRPAQSFILSEWFENRKNKKNQIIKLHTGQGKTLIGLLILNSKLNSGVFPCLYICQNIYLVEQTIQEAKKFGVPYCTIPQDKQIPEEFLNGDKILITHVHKVFNGKSMFGLNNNSISVDTVILDDSHACIDSIKLSFTIKIDKDEELYEKFISLFEQDLISQGEGSFLDIKDGNYETILPIPYWSWIDKKTETLQLLSEMKEKNQSIGFTWSMLKDNIDNYKAIISGDHIEITPYFIPMHHFGSFNNANQRILMSAITRDDSFFIKGLQFDIQSIKNPLLDSSQKWSGEKMLLIPSIFDDSLNRDTVINYLVKKNTKDFGYVSLVPSFRMAEQYRVLGGLIAEKENIFNVIQNLKNGNFKQTAVIVNRYDGIDLPDESCRLLIMDSKPFFVSLSDKYEESCRSNSDVLNTKIAQIIEQGLGRSVRGEKDYSVIVLIGGDLVKFIKSSSTNKYFSPQTKKQIEIGLEIVKVAKEELKEEGDPIKVLESLLQQSIIRDEGWKEFYKQKMNELEISDEHNELLCIFQLERDAEQYQYSHDSERAVELMQKIIDTKCTNDSEKGWYLQVLARYTYNLSQMNSNNLQKSAFRKNYQLLHPKEGLTYKKLAFINENRIKRIRHFINKHDNYEELMLTVEHIIDMLTFGIPAEKFEGALQELGDAIGFLSQRPDKEYKKGPDNLWCGVGDKYILLECKSEVSDKRQDINKHEVGQMNSHCGWFEKKYEDKLVKRMLIIPIKSVTYSSNFTHSVEIMRKNRLKKLRDNVKNFFKEFKIYDIKDISDQKIQEFISHHDLSIDDFFEKYSEKCYQKPKLK